MAFLIDQLNNSGLFAQSAYSAGIATCDSDGNIITATYLSSHQTISANEWNSSYETVQSNSATWNTVTDKLDTTAYTPFDPTYISGVVDNKLDTTAFSTVSGTFLTAHQSISANEWNSSYETVLTNSASWSGGTVESYDLSAGDNIQITKDDVNSAIGIAVTGLNQTNWNNSYTALTSTSGNWNNTRSTVQSNSASWAQGTTYTEGDGIDITNNVISLDSPIVFSAGSGLSVTMDSNTARIDVTAQGGGAGDMEVSKLDYSTLWEGENVFYNISGYDGSAFSLGSFYVTDSDSIFKNGGDSLIEINDIGIRLDNPDGGYSEQSSFYGGDYFHIGSYSNPSAYIEGYANGRIELYDSNHVSGELNVSSISSWNDVYNTVQTNSGSWTGGGGSYTGDAQGALDEVYTNSGNWNDTYTNVSTNSAGWGGDTVALSAGEGIGIDLGVSAVTISSTYGSDISYLSATIGDVESLLAQL